MHSSENLDDVQEVLKLLRANIKYLQLQVPTEFNVSRKDKNICMFTNEVNRIAAEFTCRNEKWQK